MPFDLESFRAELRTWAEAAGWPVETLRYGDHPEQQLDVRLPAGGETNRVAVVLHGGFWRARYDRSVIAALALDLARRGWASCNVEYRRVGTGGGVPETLDDVAAALDRARAELRPTLVLVLGHSAGGHLALWAAGTGKVDRAVSLNGVCDLTAAARERLGNGAAIDFVAGTPEERPDAYELADPMRRLPARVPTLLVHGARDEIVPLDQSRRYAAAAGPRCQLLELPDAAHFEVIDPRDAAWAEIAARL